MKPFSFTLIATWFASALPALAALSVTITNPAPAEYENFGFAMAALGPDRVIVGAYLDGAFGFNAGAAYLYGRDGRLLTTFAAPSPAPGDWFGYSVAAVGTDKVLVGAYGRSMGGADSGIACLFQTNGTLLTTYTNPTPAAGDRFGAVVAALGPDRVVISAHLDDVGATDAGVVYVYNLAGTLLRTITSPMPSYSQNFGYALATLGTDRIVVGSKSGERVYLVNTNGTQLALLTNPTSAGGDNFGQAIASIGTDQVLVGAYGNDLGGADSGAAHLFTTNGALLTTFTNPTPAAADWFGRSVAAAGPGKVLIGAPGDNTGASHAGVAYLFSTAGALLTTFTNPAPAASDYFGWALALAGGNQPFISAFADNAGATDAGSVYLFEAYAERPTAFTLATTMNPDGSFDLNGEANPNGADSAAWFEWGLTTNYGNATPPVALGRGTDPIPLAWELSGLAPEVVYHYRLTASNSAGITRGRDWAAPYPQPFVVADPATGITAAGATLHATVHPNGCPATAWFRWRESGVTGAVEQSTTPLRIAPRTNTVPLSQPITGLLPGRVYSFTVEITNDVANARDTGTLTTPLAAGAFTLTASAVTSSNGTLVGAVNPMALPGLTWFEWGTTTNYGNATGPLSVGAGMTNVTVSSTVSQLSGLSDYHYRVVVSNAAGVFYGSDAELNTAPGREVGDQFYVTPTLIPANTPPRSPTRITATACGHLTFPTTPDWRVRLTRDGQPLAQNLAIVSVKSTKALFDFPSMDSGFYGFRIQNSNAVTHAWDTLYESGPRFFQVGTNATAHTYNPFPRGNWTVPTQPKNYIGTESILITGTITNRVTVPQQIRPRIPTFPPWEHMDETANSGYLHLGWKKDFRLDGEGDAGVELTFGFPMDGTVTFQYAVPFQFILDVPTNVYAGQLVHLKARAFIFHGGTLSAQHHVAFSTDHTLWLNAPYDLGFPAVENGHSFRPDRLVVWGEFPVAPGRTVSYGPIDSRTPPWSSLPYADLFDDGKVTIGEIVTGSGLPDLPDYLESRISYANLTLGGQADYASAGSSTAWSYGPHDVWTTGTHDGWQDAPELWYANADMLGLIYVSSIPYYSQVAAPFFWGGVEIGLNGWVAVQSRDGLSLKAPYVYDLTVRIPDNAPASYTLATNLSLAIDAALVSQYLYTLHGGVYFDMPFIDRKDLDWASDAFWQPQTTNFITVSAPFSVQKTVSVSPKSSWYSTYLPSGLAPDATYDLISYPPAAADEERRAIAMHPFTLPAPPAMVPSVLLGTFPEKPASQLELMLLQSPPAAGTITLSPPPVNGGYAPGTVVTLTASAARRYAFTGWSGDLAGTNNPLTITMSTNRVAVAEFTSVTLTGVTRLPDGAFHFHAEGVAGLQGIVQWAPQLTTNATATNWVSLATNTTPFTFTDTNAVRRLQGYYRVQLP